ncbi:MAG: recombination protein NinB [Hydrogenophaga sp.]|nr:recombination protein NinB [Hydrogenophaga sp.]
MKQVALIQNKIRLRHAFTEFYKAGEDLVGSDQSFILEMRSVPKTREQEERYHAMVGEIAKQQTVMGRKLSAESWKRLLVDAFKHDTKDDPQLARLWAEVGDMQMAPALNHDGFVMLGEQTRKFPKLLASAFIEWLFAYGAEVGVTFRR